MVKRKPTSRPKRESLATSFKKKCAVKKAPKAKVPKPKKSSRAKRKSNASQLRRSARIKNRKALKVKSTKKLKNTAPIQTPGFLNLTTPLQTPSANHNAVVTKKIQIPDQIRNANHHDIVEYSNSSPGLTTPSMQRFVTPTFQTSPQPPSNKKRRPNQLNPGPLQNFLFLRDDSEAKETEKNANLRLGNPFLKRRKINSNQKAEFFHQFTDMHIIGKGEFGKVFRAVNTYDGGTYAIKKIPVKTNSEKSRSLALKEVHVLTYLNQQGQCPHIVQYYSVFWETEMMVCMQMQYCKKGSLKDLHAKRKLKESDSWKVLSEIAHALRFLHRHNVVHLDVKPGNILIHANGEYLLGDFGHATWIECDRRQPSFQVNDGDRRYLAPELLQDDFKNLSAADVYSLGLSILELLTKKLPHNGEEWQDLRAGNIKRKINCQDVFKKLLKKMLHSESGKRITAKNLLIEMRDNDELYMTD